MNCVEKTIIANAIIRANTHYYDYIHAIKLVNLCKQKRIPVYGVDAFLITDTKTQPFLEHSVDLSDSKDCYTDAKDYLNTKRKYGFHFEVVY